MNGEKYELLRSSVDVMISFKYLVAFCAMLIVGWNPALAATADDTTAETGSTTTQTSKTHHKKHHAAKTTAADGTSTTNQPGGDVTEKTQAATSSSRNTTTSKTSTTPVSQDADAGAGAAKSPATATTTGKGHKKKGHGLTTATSTNAPVGDGTVKFGETTPSDATAANGKAPAAGDKSGAGQTANSSTPAAAGVAAAAATAVTSPAGVATTGKGKHRRHGATTTVPQPTIVVNPATVPPLPTPLPTPTLSETTPPTSGAPRIETALPVPRPGAGTTANFAVVRTPTPDAAPHFNFNDYPSRKRATQAYPWRSGIVTTVFWIGEGPSAMSSAANHASAWDVDWEHHNGGADDQYGMSGYGQVSHASLINPFYVALPFNDLAYPDKSSRWLPNSWPRPQRRGNRPVSACQHRWIEIKNRAGRFCYAQWEDVGPVVTDDAEYVFGSSRPSASRGLDVSPAVAKYLGIDSSAITSWRFVDDEDVQPGMWLRYDEQALLFRAMKEKLHGGGTNTRIQQLEEPTPDDSDNDANQKKVGAARG